MITPEQAQETHNTRKYWDLHRDEALKRKVFLDMCATINSRLIENPNGCKYLVFLENSYETQYMLDNDISKPRCDYELESVPDVVSVYNRCGWDVEVVKKSKILSYLFPSYVPTLEILIKKKISNQQ